MKKLLMSIIGLSLSVGISAGAAVAGFDHHHHEWKTIVQEYVHTDGSVSEVDYAKLKEKPDGLNAYLNTLESVSQSDFDRFSEDQKLTFLIDAYNAFTVKLILEHYPVSSIKKIGGLFSSPWKIKFFKLLGKERFLDEMEHEIIRKQFNEPRIHLALVCASKGCPALRHFDAELLNTQLEEATNVFLRDSKRNRFELTAKKLLLGKIFEWYGADFDKKFGSVRAFVAPRMAKDDAEKKMILDPATKIEFMDYSWDLNEFKGGSK